MLKPNIIEAKKRTKIETKIIRNAYYVSDNLKTIGINKKYCILTYGCQMNVHDSELISKMLEDMSYVATDNYEDSDIVIINTCAIRENAHNKVFGILGRIKHLKITKKDIIVGLGGCMAQEEVVVDTILNNYKWLDFVFGTHNIHEFPKLLEESIEKKKLTVDVSSKEGDIFEDLKYKRDSKYKAWVNIMFGCDKFCTYCVVPYTRGKQRSRLKEDIIAEIMDLKNKGFLEVTLLGQNVNAYGKDIKDYNYSFTDLLEDVAKTNISRVRFMTSHPWDFTDEMIEIISNYQNVMPQVHLPIQSGSNRILKLMGRRYTKEDYLLLYHKLKKKVKKIAISTDIIVGFPNETREDFLETLAIVDECQFDLAYTFIYSPRVGTAASKMIDNITLDEKKERLQELNQKANHYAMENNKKTIGNIEAVLIEGTSAKDKKMMCGYTETGKLVNVETTKNNIGKIIDVEIKKAKSWSLDGTAI